jgi:hypothetical protein
MQVIPQQHPYSTEHRKRRIIVKVMHELPSEEFLSQYRAIPHSFWKLSLLCLQLLGIVGIYRLLLSQMETLTPTSATILGLVGAIVLYSLYLSQKWGFRPNFLYWLIRLAYCNIHTYQLVGWMGSDWVPHYKIQSSYESPFDYSELNKQPGHIIMLTLPLGNHGVPFKVWMDQKILEGWKVKPVPGRPRFAPLLRLVDKDGCGRIVTVTGALETLVAYQMGRHVCDTWEEIWESRLKEQRDYANKLAEVAIETVEDIAGTIRLSRSVEAQRVRQNLTRKLVELLPKDDPRLKRLGNKKQKGAA